MTHLTMRVNSSANDPGNTEFGRATVTRSNGIVYAATYGADGKIHVFEIAAARTTPVEKILITPAASENPTRICLGLFQSDNSLAVAYQASDGFNNQVRYCKVNTTTWAAPTWESVAGAAGASFAYSNFDMDISDTGVPFISLLKISTTSCSVHVWCRNTSNVWVKSIDTSIFSSNARTKAGEAVSIVCLAVTGGNRDVVFAVGATSVNDMGVGIWTTRITESTGATVGGFGLQRTYMLNTIKVFNTAANKKDRHIKLYRYDTNSFEFAGMSCQSKTIHYARQTWNGLVGYQPIQNEISQSWSNKNWVGMGITYGTAPGTTGPTYYVRDTAGVVWIKSVYYSAGVSTWQGGEGRAYEGSIGTVTVNNISDNAAPFPSVTDHDMVMNLIGFIIMDYYAGFGVLPGINASGITTIRPANGETQVVSSPTLTVTADTDLQYNPGPLQVEFQFATDVGFSTSVQTYKQGPDKATYVEGTNTAGVTVAISDVLTGFALAGGTWFYRARLVDQWGNVGPWTTGVSFVVGHPPVATPTSPVNSGLYAYNGGVRTFTWNFSDISPGDSQTAFQVQIFNSVGTLIHDSGKVISTSQAYTSPALGAVNNTTLTWQVKVWDTQDTASIAFSDVAIFNLTDPPAVTWVSPSYPSGGTASSPAVSYIVNVTSGGSPNRRIKSYKLTVREGSKVIYDSGTVATDIASASNLTIKQPPNYIQNGKNYSAQVAIVDEAGMSAVSPIVPFATSWTAPPFVHTVAWNYGQYDAEDQGYVTVTWDDTNRQAQFTHWTVYREADTVDPVTGAVIEYGTWERVTDVYDINSTYAIQDYFVPAGYRISYAVTQWVNQDGQDIEGQMGFSTAFVPQSDGYWLVNQNPGDNTTDVLKLRGVTGDSYTEEQEETEFNVIGRGRVVNRGQYLGPKGSLDVRIRGTDARQKRIKLLEMQQKSGILKVRNPFGDIIPVNMSNMTVSRLAGVGSSEFCDVTLPYAKVD